MPSTLGKRKFGSGNIQGIPRNAEDNTLRSFVKDNSVRTMLRTNEVISAVQSEFPALRVYPTEERDNTQPVRRTGFQKERIKSLRKDDQNTIVSVNQQQSKLYDNSWVWETTAVPEAFDTGTITFNFQYDKLTQVGNERTYTMVPNSNSHINNMLGGLSQQIHPTRVVPSWYSDPPDGGTLAQKLPPLAPPFLKLIAPQAFMTRDPNDDTQHIAKFFMYVAADMPESNNVRSYYRNISFDPLDDEAFVATATFAMPDERDWEAGDQDVIDGTVAWCNESYLAEPGDWIGDGGSPANYQTRLSVRKPTAEEFTMCSPMLFQYQASNTFVMKALVPVVIEFKLPKFTSPSGKDNPLFWYCSYDDTNTADLMADPTKRHYECYSTECIMPAMQMQIRVQGRMSYQYFRPVSGSMATMHFGHNVDDLASALTNLDAKVQELFNIQSEQLQLMFAFYNAMLEIGTAVSDLNYNANLEYKLEKAEATADTVQAVVSTFASLVGAVPILGAVVKAVEGVVQGVVDVTQRGISLMSRYGYTQVDIAAMMLSITAIDMAPLIISFKDADDLLGITGGSTETDPAFAEKWARLRTLYHQLGDYYDELSTYVKMSQGQHFPGGHRVSPRHLLGSVEYYVSPLYFLPRGVRVSQTQLFRELNFTPETYENFTRFPMHGFLRVEIPRIDRSTTPATLWRDGFTISVGDFLSTPLAIMFLQFIGMENVSRTQESPSMLGYYEYSKRYIPEKGEFVLPDPEHQQHFERFWSSELSANYLLVAEFEANLRADMLRSFLNIAKKNSPAYSLLHHNCQSQSMEIAAFCTRGARPGKWWQPEFDLLLAQDTVINRAHIHSALKARVLERNPEDARAAQVGRATRR